MKILCFDTETTGLPKKNEYPSVTNIDEWPYIVQLGFILYDTDEHKIIIKHDFIVDVNENNVIISDESVKIHKITNTLCKEYGLPIHNVLNCFLHCLHKCDILIAHNLEFDWKIINAEILRQLIKENSKLEKKLIQNVPNIIKYCTMKNSIELCKIETLNKYTGEKYYKFPRQDELHKFLFNEVPNNLHNAFNDVLVCIRCFYKLWYDEDILIHSKKLKSLFNKVK
jgi:DNA polymerase III epsilon subunit-like protein